MNAKYMNRRLMVGYGAVAALLAAALAGAPSAGAQEPSTIRVGVTAGPHAEVLDAVKKVAAERGLNIKVVEFTDYVFPNQALANKDLEANSFQPSPISRTRSARPAGSW